MMLLKHQQINLKNGNTSNTEEINNTSSGENNNTPENTSSSSTPVEKTLATFSTKIYSKDSARQNNIKITCNSLNNTTVKNGSTFSFCNTVGQATSAKGYQKADIFDKDGNTLALRPDITPSVARAAATLFGEEEVPIRLCYTGNTFINHSNY